MFAQRARIGALAVSAAACALAGASTARGSDFVNVVKSGVAVPGQGTSFTNVNLAGVDASAGAAFVGSFTIGGTNYSGLYRAQGGVLTTIADRGTSGPAGETINSIIATGDYENGMLVFAADTTAGRAMYRYTPGQGLSALVRQGDVLPGSTSPVSTFYNRGVSGDANNFAFGTARADDSTVLFIALGGPPVPVADNRTRVPISEMGDFIDFPELHFRNGRTAFIGRGADPDWPGPGPAPIEPAGVFVATPGNPLEIISGRNFPIPGANSEQYRFREFERPRVLPDGRVAFAGGFVDEKNPDPNAPRHMGVFVRNEDMTWKEYITSEMNLPGLHAPTFEFNQFSLETGFNFFGVNDVAGGSYIYYESAAGVFTHLIDTYELLDGKALSRVRMLGDTAIGGQLFFRADFADGTSGVYAVAVPEPAALGVLAGLALLGMRRRR